MTATIIALPERTLPPAAIPSAGRLPDAALHFADQLALSRGAEILRRVSSRVPEASQSMGLGHFALAMQHFSAGRHDAALLALTTASAAFLGRQA